MENLKTKKLNTHMDFMDLEEELQMLLQKYPNIKKIDVVYAQNKLNSMQLATLELAYSNSQCTIIYDESNEFETYFRLQFDRLGICTWNQINQDISQADTQDMSQADKDEERGIEMLENERQGN